MQNLREVRLNAHYCQVCHPYYDEGTLQHVGLDVVGLMPTSKNDAHCKKYIIAPLSTSRAGPWPRQLYTTIGNKIQQFIGKEIVR